MGGADNYKSCGLAERRVEPASFGVMQGKETAVHIHQKLAIHFWYFFFCSLTSFEHYFIFEVMENFGSLLSLLALPSKSIPL